MDPANQNRYQSNNPLFEDNEDMPAGSAVNSIAAASSFAAAPGTAKKKIQPVNEAAVRQALADTAPAAKPAVDTSKIYRAATHDPRDPANNPPAATALSQHVPRAGAAVPQPGTESVAATMQRGKTLNIAEMLPGLQLYAIVMIIMSGLGTAVYASRIIDGWQRYTSVRAYDQAHHIVSSATTNPISVSLIVSFLLSLLPVLAGAYLLAGKRTVLIKAVLIVVGLSYAYSLVSYGFLLVRLHSLVSIVLVAGTLLSGALVYWTWRVFGNIELLEESSTEPL